MKMTIFPHDLQGPVKDMSGLARVNSGVRGCTPAWNSLQIVGKRIAFDRGLIPAKEDANTRSKFNDTLDVLVRQGGIKLDKRNSHTNKIFREDVYPSIKVLVKCCPLIFQMELHYSEGYLIKADIYDN